MIGPSAARAERAAARLETYGFTASTTGSRWSAPFAVEAVYYGAGHRRAALALADDVGLAGVFVLAEEDAPAPVTLSLVR